MITANWEVTDTFGGESNYSWVKRGALQVHETHTDRAITRLVKRVIGWTGVRCEVDYSGDMITIRPRGQCMVCFITFD